MDIVPSMYVSNLSTFHMSIKSIKEKKPYLADFPTQISRSEVILMHFLYKVSVD